MRKIPRLAGRQVSLHCITLRMTPSYDFRRWWWRYFGGFAALAAFIFSSIITFEKKLTAMEYFN
jgi:uncharacterized membrane protein YdcZ (DUF606 family)